MFAVPGWAVSADVLVPAKSSDTSPARASGETAVSNSISISKKRRRNGPALSESRITSEDLQKVWNKEFGNGISLKGKASRAAKRKRPQEHSGAELRHKHRVMREVDGDNDATVLKGNDIDLKHLPEIDPEQTAKHKRKKKLRETTASQKNRAGLFSKTLGADGKAGLAEPSQHEKVEGYSETISRNMKAHRTLQKMQELEPSAAAKLTPLQAKMRDKLTSARFRHLNETLYTSPSSASLDLFTASPDLFAEYHAGFAQQVRDSWPENPVEAYIHDIRARAKASSAISEQDVAPSYLPLPRRKTGSCTIADLGCGDAALARAFQSNSRALNLRIHSFDLHTTNSLVTKADIANLPLRDGEADIAVFCLSLMGTNWISFIEEGWRVLRGDGKGEIWIAEVKSRFGRVVKGKVVENGIGKKRTPQKIKINHGKGADLQNDGPGLLTLDEGPFAEDETDISAFVTVVQRRGFALQPNFVKKHNKMFVSMIFNKIGIPAVGKYKGSKWNGQEYEASGVSLNDRKKFIDENNEDEGHLSPGEEGKVLKPCVYKKR